MKKHIMLCAVVMIFAALLTGCPRFVDDSKKSSGKTEIYFDIRDSNGNSRTALPTFNFDIFKYTLTATKDRVGLETPLKTNCTFSSFSDPLAVEPAVYVFTLTGYNSENKPVLQGVSKEMDLTKGSAEVQFRMYPLSGEGLVGNIEITVNLPSDNVIKSIKACVTENLTTLPSPMTEKEVVGNSVVYAANNVSAGKKQYAVIFLYDENGGCISSVYESLIVVAGQTSRATRTITSSMYHKYQVNIKFITTDENGTISGVFTTKTLTVKGEDGNNYTMTIQSDGSYSGMLPEQKYTVIYNGKDTGVSFTSPNTVDVVEFKKVSLPTGGITLDNIKNGVVSEDGTTVLVPSTDETFTAEVVVKPGYEVENGTNVTVNGNSAVPGGTIVIPTDTPSISVDGVTPIEYTISYNFESGGSFKEGYTAPASYTVENYPALPDYTNVSAPEGKFLDGWKLNGNPCAYIPSGTTGNITLVVVYKAGVTIPSGITDEVKDKLTEEEKAAVEEGDVEGVIFASGYSLLIKWKDDNPSSGETEVYYDYNGNGVVEESDGDKLIGGGNYTKYILKAADYNNGSVASDFTFNMKGGNIASLVGLGKDKTNKSTVNISGNCIIGNGSTIGIDLASFTGETVNIDGQMTGEYSITLLSEHAFDPDSNTNRIIAYIENPDYAQFKYFKCLPKGEAKSSPYVSPGESGGPDYLRISGNTVPATQGKAAYSYVYLFNPNPIALPTGSAGSDTGIVWEPSGEGLSDTDFSLGNTASIIEDCSVFSLSVKNGRFKIRPSTDGSDPTKLTDKFGNQIPTDDLCQYKTASGTIAYRAKTNVSDSVLQADKEYVYLHMFSTKNQITADAATKFLRNIIFLKDDPETDIDITVNLETVPFEQIENFLSNGVSVTIPKVDSNGTSYSSNTETVLVKGKAFSYYDGSFYLGVVSTIDWIKAYNLAKASTFNGLNGYLMTISSDVENNYIDACMGLSLSWMGGSRMYPKNGTYDATTYTIDDVSKNYSFTGTTSETKSGNGEFWSTDFKWQCGPDAGKTFTQGYFNVTGKGSWGSPYDYGYKKSSVPEGSYANWETDEPNNYKDIPETTVQFHSNGQWNDLKWNTTDSDYSPKGYIIEFTPYELNGFKNEATAKNIKATASY